MTMGIHNEVITSFIQSVITSYEDETFLRLTFGKVRDKQKPLVSIKMSCIVIKGKRVFSVVYTNKTQDITKNYSVDDLADIIESIMIEDCKNAVLFTSQKDLILAANKKGVFSLSESRPTIKKTSISHIHDHQKEMFISQGEGFLQLLNITTKQGELKKNKIGKYKQINKFLEVLDHAIRKKGYKKGDEVSMLDMGSGKGYLTFASYNYLLNTLGLSVKLQGIEFRQEMVDLCNNIAQEVSFDGLSFVRGSISDHQVEKNDILVALHACDTATDDAIKKGITSKSSIIILSPCCHKQIRKELHITDEISEITASGIYEERLSEMITDTLRKMYLELHGYSVQIFEFVPDSYTHKNTMITAIKKDIPINTDNITNRISNFKKKFGIEKFYLEEVFRNADYTKKTL